MKKIISLGFIILLLLSCFSFTALGTKDYVYYEEEIYGQEIYIDSNPDAVITLSEDYKTLYCGDEVYTRFSDSTVNVDIINNVANVVELSDTQKKEIEEVSVETNEAGSIIWADIYFNDGANLKVAFLNEDYIEEYNNIMEGESGNYTINFGWPEENIVKAQKESFFGESVNLFINQFVLTDYFDVVAMASDESFYVSKGQLLIYDDEYYYVDFEKAEVDSEDFYIENYSNLVAYKITDMDLRLQIEEAMQKYYDDDLGIFFDDDFTESVANIFLIVIFAVIPFAIFVTFLILALRSKTIYKKFFTVICALSASELFIFAVVTIYLLILK